MTNIIYGAAIGFTILFGAHILRVAMKFVGALQRHERFPFYHGKPRLNTSVAFFMATSMGIIGAFIGAVVGLIVSLV